ncbi:MAG: TetR family transcriptional regulator C-terminal domain-containing protein [Bacilli bacterium]|nr:TetR family transcriptional regulator C-terminal domain-containing protein [Bacilli bacterium]
MYVFNSLYENIFEVNLERFGVEEENKKYIFSFFIFGLVTVIQTWIENDCKDKITKITSIIKDLIGFYK